MAYSQVYRFYFDRDEPRRRGRVKLLFEDWPHTCRSISLCLKWDFDMQWGKSNNWRGHVLLNARRRYASSQQVNFAPPSGGSPIIGHPISKRCQVADRCFEEREHPVHNICISYWADKMHAIPRCLLLWPVFLNGLVPGWIAGRGVVKHEIWLWLRRTWASSYWS